MQTGRLRGMKSAESEVGYLEVDAIVNGEPVEVTEKSV